MLDGIQIDDSELSGIDEMISKTCDDLKIIYGDVSDDVMDMQKIVFMNSESSYAPPIVNIIDQLTNIIKLLPKSNACEENINVCNSEGDGDSPSLHNVVILEQRTEEGIERKQLEISNILLLTEKVL